MYILDVFVPSQLVYELQVRYGTNNLTQEQLLAWMFEREIKRWKEEDGH